MLKFQPFDAAYLEKLRLGDAETERNFFTYFSQLIRIKVSARVRSAQQAEDIRQETLLRAFRAVRSAGGIHSPEGLGAFVNSVCNNVLLESLRSQRRNGTAPLVDREASADVTAGPEECLLQEERSGLVRQVLGGLTPRDRSLLSAVFLEERDKDEVCAQFGIGRDYLRVLLYRAKMQFRDLFAAQQSEGRPKVVAEGRVK